MKLIFSTLVVVCFSCLSNVCIGQSGYKPTSTMQTVSAEQKTNEYSYKVNSEKLAQKKKTSADSYESTKDVAYYDNFISALETKREYVLNNPEEKAIAEKEGWLIMIEKEINKAKAAREALLQK